MLLLIRENEDKYGYPHPFQDGFSSTHEERIVAPFWADVDLTTDQGDVFYQVKISPRFSHCQLHEIDIQIFVTFSPSFFFSL